MAKVDKLLATLRGEAPPEEAPAPEAAPEGGGAAAVPSAEFEALKAKIAELEEKMGQMAAPPPMDMPAEPPPEEVPPSLPPEPPPTPPAAPTELTLFMQTRMELLERKLDLAQQEALRSGLLLREREEAQRKAQGEVEDLFRSMREAQRAASYDKTVREHAAAAEAKAKELEARLAMAELRMVPAEDVLRFVETEEGRAELVKRLGEQVSRAAAAGPGPSPAAPTPSTLPPAGGPVPFETLAAVLGRVSDLEKRLADSERERVRQAEERKRWEGQIAASLSTAASRFARAGGPDLLVEAALEAVVESVRRRDALQQELSAAVSALQDEPPGSQKGAELRGRLALAHKEMAELQADIDKQLALVRAWVARESGGGS
ncbi:hypothetical protein EPO15_17850 [bacterium]|nr:MAG: hypothetical protein EPO15_17850 [bacterium]